MNTWIDYTRRNDPACEAGLEILKKKLGNTEEYPNVFCFWTKNPYHLALLYKDVINDLKKHHTLVLCIATINPGYQTLFEPGVKEPFWNLSPLIEILGKPDYVRLRFDPVIKGFTTMRMFKKNCEIALKHGIKDIITNFFVPEYKDTWKKVQAMLGKDTGKFTKEEKIKLLNKIISYAEKNGINIHACAETAKLCQFIKGLKPASCADPSWPKELGFDFEFKTRASRPGCGCCYSGDWGVYSSWKEGYKCPHGCVYCYAK